MIFNKIKKITTKTKDWDDITLEMFNQIETIVNSKSPTINLELQRVIYGEKGGNVQFLDVKPTPNEVKKYYILNGRKYILQADISKLTTSQYIDFTHSKTINDYLAVVLIPNGKQYNEGYDIQEVKNDVLTMKIKDCIGIVNFLFRQFQVFIQIFQDYLKNNPSMKLAMKENMTENQRTILLGTMELLTMYIQSAIPSI